ncbi:ATP-NAD/AcoX kinase [Staphylothermus hellenicus DSM 12710]|uniref:NAD kinase n=2 Tax=Staphylothermus hellenicus TaxID=84599 RepID=D7DAM0_STAHD|nr:ATP-NAD/AcoX kinase [Staphylothermus hellenicus DSM 12710]
MKEVFKRALVIYRPTPTCLEKTKKIIELLREYGLAVNSFWVDDLIKEMKIKTDLVVSIGGDGTLLKISRVFQDTTPLILPIPCGRRTALYEPIDTSDLEKILDMVMNGLFTIQTLSRIDVILDNNRYTALNEAELISIDRGRVIRSKITVKTPAFVSEYYLEGDGILIGTSPGSAAYNLSVRGPFIDYFLETIYITPLNPMELNISPIIVPPLSKILIETMGIMEIYIDGERTDILGPHRKILVEHSNKDFRIMRIYGKKDFIRDVFEKRRILHS